MSQIVIEDHPDLKERYCALIGPSFSSELFKKWPTLVSVAGFNQDNVNKVLEAIWSPFLKGYYQPDVIGCELAGAFKNV